MAGTNLERFQFLLDVSQLLSSKLELSELLPTVLSLASRVVEAESASLLLFDKKTQTLYFDVALGLGPEVNRIRLPLGQGIAGHVAKSKESLIIKDAPKDPRWSPQMDKLSGFATRSILAVPMTLQGRLVGVLEAINKKDGAFSDDDRQTLEAFAVQAAIAIEHARLFASLAEERFRLECIFASMADGAILSDEVGQVLVANDAARKILGLDGNSGYVTDAWKDFILKPGLEEILANRSANLAFEAARESPTKLVLTGLVTPTKLDHFSAGSSKSASKPGLLCVFRDVTEEKRKEKLKRSFLDLISHKLKTPLVSIIGYGEVLLESYASQPEDAMPRKALVPLSRQSHKLSELIDKLLKYTALEDPGETVAAFRPCALDQIAAEAAEEMKPWLTARNARVSRDGAAVSVNGDRLQLKDMVKNLIENAVKFDPKEPRAVSARTASMDGSAMISITDKGPGIPPEELDRVFRGFEQVDEDFTGQVEGWGLGLPFVKKVAERHGGSVEVHSRIGEGTTVTVRIPAMELV